MSQSKVKPPNDVPFANPPLPSRLARSCFADESHDTPAVDDKDIFTCAEKVESKADIQILLGQSIAGLSPGSSATNQPSAAPAVSGPGKSCVEIRVAAAQIVPPAEEPGKDEDPAVRRARLNSQEEIGRRQSYFKMVELERDQCENKAQAEKKAVVLKTPHPAWDTASGNLKVRPGEMVGRYMVNSVAGKGVFGAVLRCTDTSTKTEAALKVIRNRDVYAASGERELKILLELNQGDPYGNVACVCEMDVIDRKNIIRVLSTFVYQNHLCIAMEPFDANLRETFTRVTKFSSFSLSTIQSYAQQLLKALYYMKKKGVVHADSI